MYRLTKEEKNICIDLIFASKIFHIQEKHRKPFIVDKNKLDSNLSEQRCAN